MTALLESCTIPVSGMTCVACSSRVQRSLEKTPGVASASVNLMTGEATVDFDPAAVAPERLVAVIRESGYGADLPRADATAEAAFDGAAEMEAIKHGYQENRRILIEGLPGSGKSTTTVYLQALLQRCGIDCRRYLEEDRPHPIDCTDFATHGLAGKVMPLWLNFADGAGREPVVTIIESRLWQNTALFMYMSECSLEEITSLNHQVGQVLLPLAPVLVYLDEEDTETALRRLYTLRGKKWMDETMGWTTQYPWFISRGLNDFAGWVRFFAEWRQVAEQLYADWPGKKLKILNPHADWAGSYRQLRAFLQVDEGK